MSNDNPWGPPNQRPDGHKQPGSKGEDGWGEPRLPGPGETWDDVEQPRSGPPDMNWGTAGPDLPPGPPPSGSPFGPPSGPPPAGSPFGPPPGPGPSYGYPMTHTPGVGMTPASGTLDNNDIVALIVSAFFPGAGHMMLGQTTKGIAILAATYLTCGLGYLAFAFVVIDAYFLALARKKRQVGDWEFLPK